MNYPQVNKEIRASFAKRIGEIIGQYSEFQEIEAKKYEVTLSIMALQSLSILWESFLIKNPGLKEEEPFSDKISDEPGLLGVCNEHIKLNTFPYPYKVTNSDFINHIRNAMCHQVTLTKATSIPLDTETGFYTKPTPKVEPFLFIDRSKKLIDIHTKEEAEKIKQSIQDSSRYFSFNAENLKVEPKNNNNEFEVVLEDRIRKKVLRRIFCVQLSPKTISKLVKNLSDILSKDLAVVETSEFAHPAFY